MSIILNVSGKVFRVPHDIICKSQLFNGMLTDCEINYEIMIDRSAKLFKHVYAFLLDDKYPYPRKYYSELDYYLVPYNIDLLYDPNTTLKNELKLMISNSSEQLNIKIRNIYDRLKYCDIADVPVQCAYEYCDVSCMLPVCEYHRGTCCFTGYEYNKYGSDYIHCNAKIDINKIYCDKHVDDR